MDRKEETRLKALQNKIEEKAQEYKDKYSLLLDEARKEAEQTRREAEQARREAEQARREAEIEHQKALKLCEETRRRTARIRTAANREVPDGTIGSIVKTEWGDLFNIAQTPS
jgi:dsDNA-specific endonuclease/ATPase MutS2